MIRGSTWQSVIVKFGVLLAVVVGILYTTSRYEIYTLPAHEDGMAPLYAASSMVLADTTPSSYSKGDVVIFKLSGSEDIRIGRIHALQGDHVEQGSKGVQVNGATLFRGDKQMFASLPPSAVEQGVLLTGQMILLNDNIHSIQPDSQRLGLLKTDWIIARVICAFPW